LPTLPTLAKCKAADETDDSKDDFLSQLIFAEKESYNRDRQNYSG